MWDTYCNQPLIYMTNEWVHWYQLTASNREGGGLSGDIQYQNTGKPTKSNFHTEASWFPEPQG